MISMVTATISVVFLEVVSHLILLEKVTVEAQYDYDFPHLHELMKTLRKTNQGSPGGKSKSSPSKRREKKQVGVTREEVMQIKVLPDIVTSNFPDVLENDKTQIYEELHWTSLLSRCVMEILHTTPSFSNTIKYIRE